MRVHLFNCSVENAEFIKSMLAEGDCYVHSTETYEESIEVYKFYQASLDVIVCDIDTCPLQAERFAQYNFEHNYLPLVIVAERKDASHALKLLEFGVHDYLIKPFESNRLFSILKNAISRREVAFQPTEAVKAYPGNVEKIIIPTKLEELQKASNWIEGKVSTVLTSPDELGKFSCLVGEFLTNAYEHGNLCLTEEEKGELVRNGTIHDVLYEREKECSRMIQVGVSVLDNEIAVSITDGGRGFKYKDYLQMSNEAIIERIDMPNGRGIVMGRSYFDRIEYLHNGSTVHLVKTVLP